MVDEMNNLRKFRFAPMSFLLIALASSVYAAGVEKGGAQKGGAQKIF